MCEPATNGSPDDDDDGAEPEERDPSGRFERYAQTVGKGRFKCVFKGFDTSQGIDIAWSKVLQDPHNLDEAQMKQIAKEMATGLKLDHNNIIKCYKCWRDPKTHCINLVTEFFTSGNLRDYRQKHHKQIELTAVKKWARQVLLGLNYLHSKSPPIIHGDLRCDKIYINGHSGEIAIGDLGLKTLLPTRFPPTVLPTPGGTYTETDDNELPNQYTRQVDVFAFGLVMLELVSLRRMDRCHSTSWPSHLDAVKDQEAKVFIAKCLGPEEARPSVAQLLEDRFLRKVSKRPSSISGEDHLGSASLGPNGLGASLSHADDINRRPSVGGTGSPTEETRRGTVEGIPSGGAVAGGPGGSGGPSTTTTTIPDHDDSMSPACLAGQVQGEDYTFTFSGKLNEGKLNVELQMQYDGSDDDNDDGQADDGRSGQRRSRTIDFEYNPDEDTADEVASEMGNEFDLSSTDRDICAAALKEWLGREGDN